ncbi:hypothetical protein SARC_12683 [Sphaeroforma arctica JP610]|uniref:Uncharacterized protein n=1 Tax=Sphaeroforma arctica JP610 TaxID=667725 RepID=A0A0L0FDE0_9EUKA|nr:hypothetical protein SARC_12683 [Sphaeroforma arctica JP610]KNC74777.1 hypothetical protein SARC_12683 [Sphaeroforma arctica JP610]|eukprot:XP_014148679.1 hypothetical protein SARC_12683 [Sphaeroforma arctica JP610]
MSQGGGSLGAMYTCNQSAKSPKLTRRQKDMAKVVDTLPAQGDMDLDEPVVPEPISTEERARMEEDPVDEPL